MSKRFLIISQVYVPDPAAVGQYLHDAARELVRRGNRVEVVTSSWGHHDTGSRYRARECIDGVDVRRLPASNFGKSSLALRVLGSVAFLAQAVVAALRAGPFDDVLVSTSPPIAPSFGLLLARALRARLHFWVMDINPDQALSVGAVSEASPFVRLLEMGLRATLAGADDVIVLDEFMLERLRAKTDIASKVHVIPPWPLEEHEAAVPHDTNPFRIRHRLEDKFVIMYSGNISRTHPLDTLLEAAVRLRHDRRIVFVIIGDGTGRAGISRWVERHPDIDLRLLPYQPQRELKNSLSAADVHVVSLGDAQVGIVHPCKVYGVMAVGRPFLFFGPERSHLGEIASLYGVGQHVAHGDVERAVQLIVRLARMTGPEWSDVCGHVRLVLEDHFSRQRWLSEFCRLLEGDELASSGD